MGVSDCKQTDRSGPAHTENFSAQLSRASSMTLLCALCVPEMI